MPNGSLYDHIRGSPIISEESNSLRSFRDGLTAGDLSSCGAVPIVHQLRGCIIHPSFNRRQSAARVASRPRGQLLRLDGANMVAPRAANYQVTKGGCDLIYWRLGEARWPGTIQQRLGYRGAIYRQPDRWRDPSAYVAPPIGETRRRHKCPSFVTPATKTGRLTLMHAGA
ncbi:hypothetical protein DAI22_09g068600 [Oryza sativa Japonica Group]|nr:hypothetical protein DAI22_09g068600 [Oryza sativa Japonica Group]